MRALEKDRTRRFETVSALALDVQRHLENEPVVSRPPSQVYRLRKLVQRNKVVFGAIASVAIALAVAFRPVSGWQYGPPKPNARRACSALRPSASVCVRKPKETKHSSRPKTRKGSETEPDEHATMALDTLQQMKMQRAEDFSGRTIPRWRWLCLPKSFVRTKQPNRR